jgi:hypothetical protein
VTALEGELVGREVARPAPLAVPGEIRYTVHVVDLPSGGRIDGMGEDDARRIARQLGTRCYRAQAVLITAGPQTGLVIVSPIEEMPRAAQTQGDRLGHR